MVEQYIRSEQNSLVKEYKKLLTESRQRKKLGKIAVEGPNLLQGALDAGLIPEVVFYTRSYFDNEGKLLINRLLPATKKVILTPELFSKLAETENPQCVAAIVPFAPEVIQAEIPEQFKLVVILDRLQDPGNMGSIIRTSAAAGMDAIYYIRGSVDPYSPKVLRSTAGLVFSIPVIPVDDPLKMIPELKQKSFKVIAASRGGEDFWCADYGCKKAALIIGNEAGGISKEILALADLKVAIPLKEPVESLNAATAAAVITYEIIRRFRAMS